MSKLKQILRKLGPGFITGASDDDPSGIATYTQTGAQFGYNQLWTALFTFPFMTVIQEMCGRIGIVTGKGLAAVIKQNFARPVLFGAVMMLFLANTLNVGADLGAMASAGQLILNIPFAVWLLGITALILILEIFVSYAVYAKILKYLTISLFAYVVVAFLVKQDWNSIAFSTFVPHIAFHKEYLLNLVAILGTTISPYIFFWQADEEVEEEIEHHRLRAMGKGVPKIFKGDIRDMRIDTIIGMLFSNLAMFFIIVTSASTLGAAGITSIQTADQAAVALRPLAGDAAFLLFALGILGTGLLAVPILAGSAAYAISESFNWEVGLEKKFKQAHGFYLVIIIAMLIGMLVNFSGVAPFRMLYYAAIMNGLCAPPLLVLIMLIGRSKKIMGEHINSAFSNWVGWLVTIIMFIASLGMIVSLLM